MPASPGEVLRSQVLDGMGITQDRLAAALGVSRVTVNGVLNGRRRITADMALRLGRVLGLSPRTWLGLQAEADLCEAESRLRDVLAALPRLRPAVGDMAGTTPQPPVGGGRESCSATKS